MGGTPKIGGKPPKMDGENNGKPYEQMDDFRGPNQICTQKKRTFSGVFVLCSSSFRLVGQVRGMKIRGFWHNKVEAIS